MWKSSKLLLLFVGALFGSSLALAQSCPWMSVGQIDQAYPERAPWSVLAGGQGRCKFISGNSTISLTQMIQASPAAAASYVKTVGGGMARSYRVAALPAIGKEGVAVREQDPEGSMLTLIGHEKSIVVMAQLSFHGGVSAAQQATAERLTRETFTLDTGGGLILPPANSGDSSGKPARPAAAPATPPSLPPPPPTGPGSPAAGVTWKPIPKGTFRMGCVDGDKRCGAERAHDVTLTRAFDMAETETTNGSYNACVKAGACKSLPPTEWIGKNNEPVVNVSRDDGAAFCAWAGGRLPSEAEWELAARGGKEGLVYPNGNTISHDEANFTGTGGRDKWKEIAPVKSFPPNGYGLYDMAGNVWEWVADWYDIWNHEPAVDPRGPATGDGHVNRGGSWYSFESFLRTSYRVRIEPGVRFDYGFRCVRDTP